MDADSLQNLLDGAKFQLRCKEGERSKFAEKNKELQEVLRKQKDEIKHSGRIARFEGQTAIKSFRETFVNLI